MQHQSLILALLAGLSLTGAAQAALQARDLNKDTVTDAYYDTVLNITWLKDANLAKTNTFGLSYGQNLGDNSNDNYGSAYNEILVGDGSMNWGAALNWIDAMNKANYLGHNNWRLPDVKPINGSTFATIYSANGSTDVGYNISAPGTAFAGATGSELAFMHYQNLGNSGWQTPTGGPGCYPCLVNVGPFDNIQRGTYWSGSVWLGNGNHSVGWAFGMNTGDQLLWDKAQGYGYAWAVLDGDVAAVPEPQTYAMLLAGLGLMGWVARRRG